mgnify:CR=1 FL=1
MQSRWCKGAEAEAVQRWCRASRVVKRWCRAGAEVVVQLFSTVDFAGDWAGVGWCRAGGAKVQRCRGGAE